MKCSTYLSICHAVTFCCCAWIFFNTALNSSGDTWNGLCVRSNASMIHEIHAHHQVPSLGISEPCVSWPIVRPPQKSWHAICKDSWTRKFRYIKIIVSREANDLTSTLQTFPLPLSKTEWSSFLNSCKTKVREKQEKISGGALAHTENVKTPAASLSDQAQDRAEIVRKDDGAKPTTIA